MTELKFSMTVKSLLDFFPLSMLKSTISSGVSVLKIDKLNYVKYIT